MVYLFSQSQRNLEMTNDSNILDNVVDNTPATAAKASKFVASEDRRIVVSEQQREAEKFSEAPFSWSNGRATEHGFNSVSNDWYDKTVDWDTLREHVAQSQQLNHDESHAWHNLRLECNGSIRLITPDGQKYRFTEHSQSQLGNMLGLGSRIFSLPQDTVEHELLNQWLSNRWAKIVANKDETDETFLRFRDGKVRAFLSDRYLDLPHEYILELFAKMIPDGRVSHFSPSDLHSTEGDLLRFNVLIPDSFRSETDSEYGGMLTVGNSEIGKRRFNSLPSVFRAICMNGCIWSQHEGKAFSKVHRGKAFDRKYFEWLLAKDIQEQLPLASEAIDSMLRLRACQFGESSLSQGVLAIASKFSTPLTREQQGAIIARSGSSATMPVGDDAFCLIQAITETVQDRSRFDVYQQDAIEAEVGKLAIEWLTKPSSWDKFVDESSEIDFEKVLKVSQKFANN